MATHVQTTDIKTINGNSLLGGGNIDVSGGSATTDASALITGTLNAARLPTIPANKLNVKAFNVLDYGAIGDGTADDSTAFQSCFTAAIAARGEVIIPSPSNYYKITTTINIVPASGSETYVNIRAFGRKRNQIVYSGTTGTACFFVNGLRTSHWQGLGIDLAATTNLIAIDLDTVGGSISSLSYNTFQNIDISMNNATGQRGWRMGHLSQNGGDISGLMWNNCTVYGNFGTPVTGQIGWHFEGSNTLDNKFFGCFGAFLDIMLSNVEGAGAAGTGNGSIYLFSQGTSQNNLDYQLQNTQNFGAYQGRYESGKRLLEVKWNNKSPQITLSGLEINDYYPSDGILIRTEMPNGIAIRDCSIIGRDPWTTAMITLEGGQYGSDGVGIGRLIIDGGKIECPTGLPYTITGASAWNIYMNGVGRSTDLEIVTGIFPNLPVATIPAPAVTTKTANYTLTGSDDTVFADASAGGFTLTLPNPTGNSGKIFEIKKTDTTYNSVTVSSSAGIDTDTTQVLTVPGVNIRVQSDGTKYQIKY